MKSQRKKKEKGQPGGLRSYKVMLPETYRRTRSPLWFESIHLQVSQDREQGVIPIIYRGKEEAVMLDPRAIVFTPLDPRSSARWTTPRATSPWTTMPPGPGSDCWSIPTGGCLVASGIGNGPSHR